MVPPLAIRSALWIWFFVALLAGQLLWLQRIPTPAVQGLLVSLTAALVLLYRRWTAFRAWVDALDLRALVLLHVTRFVGFYFIILYDRGELPHAFAVTGGIGDIIVAALALAVALIPFGDALRLRLIAVWNIAGLIDMLFVLATAARLGLQDPLQLRPLTHLPLSLLPTFLVPLILGSHLAILRRLRLPTS
jgi:hypothetical protein